MTESAHSQLMVVLSDEVTSGQIHVSLAGFASYCIAMELALRVLEERWEEFRHAPGGDVLGRSYPFSSR